jgi:hypothetical protein
MAFPDHTASHSEPLWGRGQDRDLGAHGERPELALVAASLRVTIDPVEPRGCSSGRGPKAYSRRLDFEGWPQR